MGQAGSAGEYVDSKKWSFNCCGKAQPDANIQVIHESSMPADAKESARSSSSKKEQALPTPAPAPVSQKAEPVAKPAPVSQAASQTVSEVTTAETGSTAALLGNPGVNEKAFATATDFGTMDYEEMTKKQRQAAKHLVKDFVKTMVKGRQLSAVLTSGQIRTCFCVLNRSLDKLQIRASEKDKQGRTIPLATIAEIIVGSDASGSAAADLETPLDNLSVTLVLDSDECITFRLPDLESRDHLAACLTMFSNQSRDMGKYGDNGKSG